MHSASRAESNPTLRERAQIIALLRREAEEARRMGLRTTLLVIEAMIEKIGEGE